MGGDGPVAGTYEGGQGRVERIVDPSGATLARKRVPLGALGSDRLADLHGALARRRHPALVRQRSVEVLAEAVVVTSDWVDGETLTEWATGAPVDAIVDRIRQVAEAVDLLHADLDPDGPLLHRDIKPSNIIVTPDGRAVLIDPGLARLGPSLVTGSPYGTPGYVPPECIGDPTAGSPAADRWQLGVTLVTALLGRAPGWDVDHDTLRPELSERVRGEVDDPDGFASAALGALAPVPADRPGSAAAWAASLRAAVGTERRPRGRVRAVLSGGGRWVTAAGVGLFAAVLIAAGALGRATGSDGTTGPVRPTGANGVPPAAQAAQAPSSADGMPAVVDTRTTSGPHVDQQYQVYLSTEARNFCRALGCEVAGTVLETGDALTLTCRIRGERATNGNDVSTLDDQNPILVESHWWFGAVDAGDRWGLISAVWIHADDRDAHLPYC